MPNSTDITSPETAAGRAAGEVFARERADMMDRGLLREAREANAATGTLLVRLFAAYADDDLSHDETAELLFEDATARPSDAYVAGFLEGAIAALEVAFAGPDEDHEDDEPLSGADPDPLGSPIVGALNWCLESGMSFPMTLVLVSRTGDVTVVRSTGPGATGELTVGRVEAPGMTFPINGLVMDEAGGAAHVRMGADGLTASLLEAPERPSVRS
jgi:hypothetical protein